MPALLAGFAAAAGLALWQRAETVHAQASGPAAAARTPWGDPDLQGVWNSKTLTPLERSEKYAGREFLTDKEVAELEKASVDDRGRDNRAERGSVADVEGAYNNAFSSFWGNKAVKTRRTSLIVDPPDGKLPALTPAGIARRNAARRTATIEGGPAGIADNPEDRVNDSCPGPTLPCTSPLCAFARIVQTAGGLSIYYESGHWGGLVRHVALDGRKHLPSTVREKFGDAVGHWEGNTLVVDTTNFNGQMLVNGSRENLHLVERFTRTEPDLIMYRATVEDATTFAKPWTIEMTWVHAPENSIYDEAACYEGNYAMTGILAGARELERERAAGKKSAPSTTGAPAPGPKAAATSKATPTQKSESSR
jgi:hypothetical protein